MCSWLPSIGTPPQVWDIFPLQALGSLSLAVEQRVQSLDTCFLFPPGNKDTGKELIWPSDENQEQVAERRGQGQFF